MKNAAINDTISVDISIVYCTEGVSFMNKFRKLLIFILALTMMANVVGCGKEVTEEESKDTTTDEEIISREEFDGFDKYEKKKIRMGDFVFEIPEYWEKEKHDTSNGYEYRDLYAEKEDDRIVMLEISLWYDDQDEVTYDLLVDDSDNVIAGLEQSHDGYAELRGDFETKNNLKGRMFEFSGEMTDGFFVSYDFDGLYSIIPSYRDNSWLYIKLYVSEDSNYTYENDYKQIIENIKYDPKKETQKTKKKTTTSKKKSEESKEDTVISQDSELFQNMLKMDDYQRSDFAKEYRGATIEFDGSIDYDVNHKDYKTRFDILATYGDYDENHQVGPTFRFQNYSAAQLADDYSLYGLPYYLKTGHNVHIKAIIKECSSDTGVFDLEPIAIKER